MPRKDLPSPNASNFLSRVREEIHAFMGRVGDGIDRALTLREMIASGLVTQGSGGGLAPGPATEYEVDLTPPPPPSNLQATTSGNSILVTINPQTYRQGNGPGTVTIYGAKYMAGDALPVFADAAVLDEFPGDVHSFPVDPGALYRIWAKSVSRDGVPSEPAGGTNGVEPVPGLLDDVSIASLTASRIRSGSVTVGQFIQAAGYVPSTAGWRINGDGTAEFSQVVVRGIVYASGGEFTGTVRGATIIGGTLTTAESGQRVKIDEQGILFLTGASNGKYGSFKYGSKKYGDGVLVYFNNTTKRVPFYVNSEQNVADIHLYNRAAPPATAGEPGDLICVNGKLTGFDPVTGTWRAYAFE